MRFTCGLSVAFILLMTGCGRESAPEDDLGANNAPVQAGEALCLDMGPQTPRDITVREGLNTVSFPLAPPASEMNLCNIHTHTNAEHKGPDFSVFVSDADDGGYACNATSDLSAAELAPADGAYEGVEPGETIEVHWVHTSCPATPGEGLGACVPENCADPLLRVEAQVFLVVNDPEALDFTDMAYGGNQVDGLHQARMIPANTGEPVLFRGSTTGPSYDQNACSPAQVTWSVRPQCAKLDINSLHRWAEAGNVFNESRSHGVRQLVTALELLSPID
ncbi:delta-class carbonic anhydrase [Candidatus Foliamicus sp.]